MQDLKIIFPRGIHPEKKFAIFLPHFAVSFLVLKNYSNMHSFHPTLLIFHNGDLYEKLQSLQIYNLSTKLGQKFLNLPTSKAGF